MGNLKQPVEVIKTETARTLMNSRPHCPDVLDCHPVCDHYVMVAFPVYRSRALLTVIDSTERKDDIV
jgi:hypothetical protein